MYQLHEHRYQDILDALHDSIAVLDPDGTISVVNEAWRRMARQSCPPEHLGRTGVGMNYLQVCRDAHGTSAELAKEAEAGIAAVLAGTQSSFTLEYPCFSPTQQSWYLMRVTPLPQNGGAVVIHVDITARKQQELTLQEANRRFEVFLAMVSHELKTPLTAIGGNIQLVIRRLEKMAREGKHDQSMQELRGPIEAARERVTTQDRMITDLLNISRICANHLEMVMRTCNLVDIVRQAGEDIQHLALTRTIHLHLPEHILVIVDADRIRQVVNNYLSNALKYSPPDRPVEVFLIADDQTARLSVKDEGPGLTPEEQTVIWERFHRVEGIQVHTKTGGDLGLGLYLCRMIIELHGGHVGVSSFKGEGSTFWFTLPLAHEAQSLPSRAE